MLTSQLINLACTITSQNSKLLTTEVFKDIKAILDFYRQDEENIPLDYKLKLSLAETLCNLRIDGLSKDTALDSVKTTERFSDLGGFISTAEGQVISDVQMVEYIKHIKNHKKIVVSLDNFEGIREFIEKFEQNDFSTMQEAINMFESVVTSMYSNYSNEKRNESISAIAQLDLLSNDYEKALNHIYDNYCGKNSTRSGYPELDALINKGFEPPRVYIFGGASGDGKSTLLANILANHIRKEAPADKKDYDIHIYVTMENLIDESLLRLYCCYTEMTVEDVVNNWELHKTRIESTLKEAQEKSKSIIVMAYYPATKIGATDIMTFAEEIKTKYAKVGELKTISVDYLDLLKSGKNYDLYRLSLGQITIDLKVMAVLLHVPVLTLTQVNRSGYDDEDKPSLTMVGESIKKVEHADFVAILKYKADERPDEKESSQGKMDIFIGKNRSGPKGRSITLITDFSKFLIKPGDGVSYEQLDVPKLEPGTEVYAVDSFL